MECVFSCDFDHKVQEVYGLNFGEKPKGDITEINSKNIPEHDVLCAGFPCQPFSISGKRGGIKDERGRLFYEIVRIAKHHRPPVLLLENVRNILSIKGGKVLEIIKSELGGLGYDVQIETLNSSFFGVPQSRNRVYFVCIQKNSGIRYSKPAPTREKVFLKDVLIRGVGCDCLAVERDDVRLFDRSEKESLRPIRIGIVNKGGQGERIYSINGHSVTLSAYGGGVGAKTGLYKVGDHIRRLHINECKRLMGFADSHTVSEGIQGYQQLGNAVIPKMVGVVYDGVKF